MIVTVKKDSEKSEIERLKKQLSEKGVEINYSEGESYIVMGLVGDTTELDINWIKGFTCVQDVNRVQAPYKKASRMFHPEDSIIDVSGIKIGGKEKIVVIGGPCAVEGKEQIKRIAKEVKEALPLESLHNATISLSCFAASKSTSHITCLLAVFAIL